MGWCERGDSNPHGLLRQILSLVRLPIPPLSQVQDLKPVYPEAVICLFAFPQRPKPHLSYLGYGTAKAVPFHNVDQFRERSRAFPELFTIKMKLRGLPPIAQRTHNGWGTQSFVNT